jgi:hypothetical protein
LNSHHTTQHPENHLSKNTVQNMFKLSAITSTILMVLSSSQNAVAFTTPTRFNTAKATIQSTRTSTTARNMIDMEPTQFTSILDTLSSNMLLADIPVAPPEGFEPSYSKASYYTILGLYIMSFPGIWSQIKRSTKAKVKRKTYVSDGEATEGGKDLRQQAGEIMACKLDMNGGTILNFICMHASMHE